MGELTNYQRYILRMATESERIAVSIRRRRHERDETMTFRRTVNFLVEEGYLGDRAVTPKGLAELAN